MPLKTVTSEQNQQWQKAVLGEHSLEQWRDHRIAASTMASLLPEAERFAFLERLLQVGEMPLTTPDIPGWAVALRNRCATQGWEARLPWVFDFATRSEIALVGITVLYPTRDAQVEAYRRLLMSFLRKGLEPFVEWAEQQEDKPQRSYRDLLDLYDLISDPAAPPSRKEWKAKQQLLEYWQPKEIEPIRGWGLCYRLVEIAQFVLFREPEQWWDSVESDLADCFFEIHKWPERWPFRHPRPRPNLIGVAGSYNRGPDLSGWWPYYLDGPAETSDAESVAIAYQLALEEVCPLPAWLTLETS